MNKNKKYRESIKVAEIYPMLPKKYNALERKKLREFELSLFQTKEDKKKYVAAINGEFIEK